MRNGINNFAGREGGSLESGNSGDNPTQESAGGQEHFLDSAFFEAIEGLKSSFFRRWMEAEAARSHLGGAGESVFFKHPIAVAVGKFLEIETYAERYQYKLAAQAENFLEEQPRNEAAITAVVLLLAALAPAEILIVMSVDVRAVAYSWLDKRCRPKVETVPNI